MTELLMLVGEHKPERAWKPRAYPVPRATRRGFRWKASMLRTLQGWNGIAVSSYPATIMVPALYNLMPAECVAEGWLDEIDTLVNIRQRIVCATKITGWDVFTFHTQHNADRFFDTTIAAVRETWLKEGRLSTAAIQQTKRRFGNPYDYHRISARLVENLVFQTALLDWVGHEAAEISLHLQVTGTALLSALVSRNSISFSAAVESATRFGTRWDEAIRAQGGGKTEDEISRAGFRQVRRLLEGRDSISIPVSRADLPVPEAPSRPFWYAPTLNGEPVVLRQDEGDADARQTVN